MDRLKNLLSNINAQLSVLTVSQRLAIGLCAALAVVSTLWLLQWSTKPDMVPLVHRDFELDELGSAEQVLRSNGIPYDVVGSNRIYVRESDKRNAVRLVHEAEALPDGSLFDMEAMVTDSNPFESPGARKFRQNYARANELSKIIETSPAVRNARVMINPETRRRLGGTSDVPTASVTVTLAPGHSMSPGIVEGIAKLVAGAVAGLKPHNVYITDARTMRSHSLPHPDDPIGFDVLTIVKRREEHYRSKILSSLADIPAVRAVVTVDLDMSKRVIKNIRHDAPEPKQEMEDTSEQSSGAGPTEVGVQANLGQALTAGTRGGTNTTEKRTTDYYEPKLSQTETIEQLPFAIKNITATIGIPRSFVLGVFRAQTQDPEARPKDDDPTFVALRDLQVQRVRSAVERIIMAKNAGDVQVDVYPDLEWTANGSVWSSAPGEMAQASRSDEELNVASLVATYGPQAGLAALALMSMLLLSRVVRRLSEVSNAARSAMLKDAAALSEEGSLAVEGGMVGQAETSESWLAGHEVDPETLRFQELGQEVSKMVKDDPEGTADLVRRWIQDDRK